MAKKRVSTTISRIHWNILINKSKTLGSQQKVIEKALELIDKEDFKEISETDEIIQTRQKLCKRPYLMLFHRLGFGKILDGDWEVFKKEKVLEHGIQSFFDEQVEELTLAQKIKWLIYYYKIHSSFEYIEYSKNDGYVCIDFHHHEGQKYSEYFGYINDCFFDDNEIEVETKAGKFFLRHKVKI